MASEYDELTGTQTYADFSERWLANILGANAWGSSFIVGDGTVFPHCMQHQVANMVGSLDGSPPIFAGAAVEGPNHYAARGKLPRMRACPPNGVDRFARFDGDAVFRDNMESYSTVEPAIGNSIRRPPLRGSTPRSPRFLYETPAAAATSSRVIFRLAITSSTTPYSTACSAVRMKSRSVSLVTRSRG